MRVDAYNQISQVYGGVRNPQKAPSVKKNGYAASDQLSISQIGQDYQVAKKAVADASDVREDRIAQIKSMIDSGKYQVDANDFADKLLENYNRVFM